MSEIINKEKARQDKFIYLKHINSNENNAIRIRVHKQSLINLKEFMEEDLKFLEELNGNEFNQDVSMSMTRYSEIKKNIKELTEMIKKYG